MNQGSRQFVEPIASSASRIPLIRGILTMVILCLTGCGSGGDGADNRASTRGFPGGIEQAFGSLYKEQRAARNLLKVEPNSPRHQNDQASWVRHWNSVALIATGVDHTPVATGETRVFGEQFGPHRSSRALAIVHLAMYEAVNAIDGRYSSYAGISRPAFPTSMEAAVSQAAHDSVAALFPSQASTFETVLAADLAQLPDGDNKANGIDLGRRVAAALLTMRTEDGSDKPEPRVGIEFVTSTEPGKWRQDPISQVPLALGAYWSEVKPFVLLTADQFRIPAPPSLSSREYAVAYNEVKALGGDGIVTTTNRTLEQTKVGVFWAYDGTPVLGAPPRMYNDVTMTIAHEMGTDTDVMELSRLLALVNVAMADAAIAAWESKYYYQFWRPVTGIREATKRTSSSGLGDGNPSTLGDPTFTPLGSPASNLPGPNFTPPFPSYPSGHATLGGAVFQMLRKFYGAENIAFTFESGEYNGMTLNPDGTVRPLETRLMTSLSQAEEENGQSRIYLGVHWAFDKTEGIRLGRKIADFVYANAFQPFTL
jgi:hypothetical protein